MRWKRETERERVREGNRKCFTLEMLAHWLVLNVISSVYAIRERKKMVLIKNDTIYKVAARKKNFLHYYSSLGLHRRGARCTTHLHSLCSRRHRQIVCSWANKRSEPDGARKRKRQSECECYSRTNRFAFSLSLFLSFT